MSTVRVRKIKNACWQRTAAARYHSPMRTISVQRVRTFVRNPAPSLPKTSIVGCWRCIWLATIVAFSAAAPTMAHPSLWHCSRNLGKFLALCTSTHSKAPAEALLTVGDKGALLRAQVITPAVPRKNALRMMAPKFCGSATSSSTTQTGGFLLSSTGGGFDRWMKSRGSTSRINPWCGL